ncbi:hypothetical protein DPMN_187205 [Dreissena polymorpha]|uniref:Uncharacterized protein n=1 Tax=Dreissena polymorpha TaxID=45954 RepID=A0A9D4DRP2_DREPO|nr:hypothetical protein DPMN_187205 [Dreissena polymorpha]
MGSLRGRCLTGAASPVLMLCCRRCVSPRSQSSRENVPANLARTPAMISDYSALRPEVDFSYKSLRYHGTSAALALGSEPVLASTEVSFTSRIRRTVVLFSLSGDSALAITLTMRSARSAIPTSVPCLSVTSSGIGFNIRILHVVAALASTRVEATRREYRFRNFGAASTT